MGDDALCMKSGRDEAGRQRGMPTQNVTIRGCTVYSAHGGFVIGSEMSGGVRNIDVNNCSFIGTDIGKKISLEGFSCVYNEVCRSIEGQCHVNK